MRIFAVAATIFTTVSTAPAVTPIPASRFIQYEAHPFDLSGKRLRFTPDGSGGYNLRADRSPGQFKRGELQGSSPGEHGRLGSGHRPLAFAFPFGGRIWTELEFNLGGSLTFGAPETALFPELDTWPDGTMRGVAGKFDLFALSGHALMIAPLWNLYSNQPTNCYINSSKAEFIATWDSVRFQDFNEGYDPLGRNVLQVRLTPNGAIEMRYGAVSERDGIVGVFSGQARDRTLDSVEYPPLTAPDGKPHLLSASVSDAGSALHFKLKLAEPLPKSAQSEVQVGALAVTDAGPCRVVVQVQAGGHSSASDCGGYAVDSGTTVDLYLSKLHLRIREKFGWFAGTGGEGQPRWVKLPNLGQGTIELSAAHGNAAGSLYEVFHYPFISKRHAVVYQELYRQTPAKDDLAIVMTDFRIDDLFNHGGGQGAVNVAIQGIGEYDAKPPDGAESYGSSRLQFPIGPVYLGPRFREKPNEGEHAYHNYAFAVGWMAHELTHRWSAYLRSTATPDPDTLHDGDDCKCHWNRFLHAPVVAPVWQLFANAAYYESSNMGGDLYETRADGAFVRHPEWAPAMGLSALDLYVMGLIPPEEVPDTFLLRNAKQIAPNAFTGEKIPIRIADIIKANGVRTPPAASSQREFTLGMYLLYDGPKPRADKLAQLQAIERMLVEYFAVATGGRMKLVAR
jgi:hypothetical protein